MIKMNWNFGIDSKKLLEMKLVSAGITIKQLAINKLYFVNFWKKNKRRKKEKKNGVAYKTIFATEVKSQYVAIVYYMSSIPGSLDIQYSWRVYIV